MKKKLIYILTFILFFTNINFAKAYTLQFDDQVGSVYAADVENGLEFFTKNESKPLPIASMTKLMTYLVVMDEVEKGNISMDDDVLITEESSILNVDGYSRLELEEGEKVKLSDLLAGMMIVSGNDSANAVAIHAHKTLDNFVKKMNDKAKELNLESAIFYNPSGITQYPEDDNDQMKLNKMSAKDLYKLSVHILNTYPQIREYGKINIFSMPERNFTKETTIPFEDMPSRIGLKTGSTPEALYGFTSLFDMSIEEETQDYELITVVIGAQTREIRDETTLELVNFVKDNYVMRNELDENISLVEKFDSKAKNKQIPLYPEMSVSKLMPRSKYMDVEYIIDETKTAPYQDGEVLGEATLYYNGEVYQKVNLINKGYNPEITSFNKFIESVREFFDRLIFMF